MTLDGGSVIEGEGEGFMDLSEDSSGTITMDDGTEINFDGVEKIVW